MSSAVTMTDERQGLNKILRPVAPPRVVEGVYTDDQYERLLDVIKRTDRGRRSRPITSTRSRS